MNKKARCAERCGQLCDRARSDYVRQGECGLRRGVAKSGSSSESENGMGGLCQAKCRNPIQIMQKSEY